MKIEELWTALESESVPAAGWWLRLARPDVDCPLFAALHGSTRSRAILLRLPPDRIPPRRRWPRCRGLEPLAVEIDGAAHFGVMLKEPRFVDVFAALAEDLSRRISAGGSQDDRTRAFLGQLARWQKFLAASLDGLGDEAQRGLWGELHVLRAVLIPALGVTAAAGWKGPGKAHQDFQLPSGALEVKTTLAKQPQIVRIASERQLDPAHWPALFLHVVALDMREGRGTSLPDLVAAVRASIAVDAAVAETFEDSLLVAGYHDAHAPQYLGRGYVVRAERSFRVKRGFPALVEADLPRGVGDVTYGLAVEACGRFATSTSRMIATLRKTFTP